MHPLSSSVPLVNVVGVKGLTPAKDGFLLVFRVDVDGLPHKYEDAAVVFVALLVSHKDRHALLAQLLGREVQYSPLLYIDVVFS